MYFGLKVYQVSLSGGDGLAEWSKGTVQTCSSLQTDPEVVGSSPGGAMDC